MALLLREAIGDSLRRARVSQSRTLREVSNSARVSLGYLSEVERGRKEASSELLASICDALEVPLSTVLVEVSESMVDRTSVTSEAATVGSTTIAKETRVVIPAPSALAAA